jgi:hypothetical protein
MLNQPKYKPQQHRRSTRSQNYDYTVRISLRLVASKHIVDSFENYRLKRVGGKSYAISRWQLVLPPSIGDWVGVRAYVLRQAQQPPYPLKVGWNTLPIQAIIPTVYHANLPIARRIIDSAVCGLSLSPLPSNMEFHLKNGKFSA